MDDKANLLYKTKTNNKYSVKGKKLNKQKLSKKKTTGIVKKTINYMNYPIKQFILIAVIVLLSIALATKKWFVSKSDIPLNFNITINDDNIRQQIQPILNEFNDTKAYYSIHFGLWKGCFSIGYMNIEISECIDIMDIGNPNYMRYLVKRLLENETNKKLIEPIERELEDSLKILKSNIITDEQQIEYDNLLLQISKMKTQTKEQLKNEADRVANEVAEIIKSNKKIINITLLAIQIIRAFILASIIFSAIYLILSITRFRNNIILNILYNIIFIILLLIVIAKKIMYEKYKNIIKDFPWELGQSFKIFFSAVVIMQLFNIIKFILRIINLF